MNAYQLTLLACSFSLEKPYRDNNCREQVGGLRAELEIGCVALNEVNGQQLASHCWSESLQIAREARIIHMVID